MNEIIKVSYENNRPTVLARELHEFLGLTERYSTWFERMLQYGFVNHEDFTSVKSFTVVNNGGKKELQDHQITIEMAKEISMLQRNEKGKQARQYFIACEKRLKEVSLPKDYLSALKALVASEEELQEKRQLIEQQKPLVEFAETVSKTVNNISVGEFAKLVADEHINIGQNKLFQWFRQNRYLMDNNVPYQKYVDKSYFKLIEQTYKTPYGTKTGTKTLITGKGQIYFVEKLRKQF